MQEEKKPSEETTEDNSEGENSPSETTHPNSILERAEKVNKSIESNIEKNTKILENIETARANALLGGNADAGQEPIKPKEETPEEYLKRAESGDLND